MTLTNPFHIPEIRQRLSLFVSIKTALSCILVSKDFSEDFVYPIWWTVNFTTHPSFGKLDHAIVVKNGRHIRVVKNITTSNQLDLLLHIKLDDSKLSEICLTTGTGCYYDLIRRNQCTLTKLEISHLYKAPVHNNRGYNNYNGYDRITTQGQVPVTIENVSPLFIYLDSLTSMIGQSQSKVTSITLRQLSITMSTFASTLRCCPFLKFIDVWDLTIVSGNNTEDFQHKGLSHLKSRMSSALKPVNHPLLMHFPNLESWSTEVDKRESLETAKDIISRYCPHLKNLETNNTSTQDIIKMINTIFITLTCLTFEYKYMTPEFILGITRRPKWEAIKVYDNFGEQSGIVFSEPDHFQHSSWMMQTIFRLCHKLVEFDMKNHIMDMDEIEEDGWTCEDLKNLKVRIKGIDTKEKIDTTIARYRDGKRLLLSGDKSKSETQLEDSIEVRLARHLLKFKKLESVWIGTETWSIKRMDFS